MDLLIKKIDSKSASEMINAEHYSHRTPQIMHAFGLYEDGELRGCVTFGRPATPQVAKSIFPSNPSLVIELNRLVVCTDAKNAASFLVGSAINLLPRPCIIVSYADGAFGHKGYVYQATNFKYCGEVKAHDSEYIWNGKKYHPRVLSHMGINSPTKWAKEVGAEKLPIIAKHRYLTFRSSNRTDRKTIELGIKWHMSDVYPKGETRRHYADGLMGNRPSTGPGNETDKEEK